MYKQQNSSLTFASISLLFIGFMFFLPFIVMIHHRPISAFYGEWLAAALGLLAMFALLSKDFFSTIEIPKTSLTFLGLALVLGLQWSLGMLHSNHYALLVLSYLIWAFLLMVLGCYLRRTLGWEYFATSLAWFILIGGLVNACITCLQIAMRCDVPIPYLPMLENYGALAQENNFADYMSLAIASLMYLYAKKRITFKAFLPILAILLTTLAFSGSRSSFVYLGFLTLMSTGFHFISIKHHREVWGTKSLFQASLLLIPIFILIQLLLYIFVPHELLSLPTGQLIEGVSSVDPSARWGVWRDSLNMAFQSPWLGIGAGNMRWASFQLLDNPTSDAANIVFEHAHNVFLHLFAEMGIGAALLAFLSLAYWLWNIKWSQFDFESWWSLSLLSIIGFHSLLEYPLWYTYFLGIVVILLGAGEEKQIKFKASKVGLYTLSVILPVAILAGILNLGSMFIAFGKIDKWLLYSYSYKLNKSEQQAFFSDLIWVKNKSLLAPYADFNLAITTNLNTNILDAQLVVMESSMHFAPQQLVAIRHAALLKEKGNHAEALIAIKRAMVAFPTNFENAMNEIPEDLRKGLIDVFLEARNELNQNKTFKNMNSVKN